MKRFYYTLLSHVSVSKSVLICHDILRTKICHDNWTTNFRCQNVTTLSRVQRPFAAWKWPQIGKIRPLLLLQLFELIEWKWSYFFDWRQFSPWNQPLKLSVRHKNTKCSSFPKNWSFSTKLFTSIQYLILSKYSDTCPNIWTRRVSNAQKDRLIDPHHIFIIGISI